MDSIQSVDDICSRWRIRDTQSSNLENGILGNFHAIDPLIAKSYATLCVEQLPRKGQRSMDPWFKHPCCHCRSKPSSRLMADAKPFWSALYHLITHTDTEDL